MAVRVTIDPQVTGLAVGLVEAEGCQIALPHPELVHACHAQVQLVRDDGPEGGDVRRLAVRQLLRAGGFKPSGRSKPAQEYLLRAADQEGQWPAILNAVDVLNVVSLRSGLPISMLALDRVGTTLLIRYGREEEAFVFNQAGQTISVAGLLCLCCEQGNGTIPIGSPVKDSQMAKVTPADQHLLACIYAPRQAVTAAALDGWAAQLADGLKRWCCAQTVETHLQPRAW